MRQCQANNTDIENFINDADNKKKKLLTEYSLANQEGEEETKIRILSDLSSINKELKMRANEVENQNSDSLEMDIGSLQKKIEEQKQMKLVMEDRMKTTKQQKNSLAFQHTLFFALAIIFLLVQICIFIFVENPEC